MAFKNLTEIRDVHGITEAQKTHIKAFMQGAIYGWIRDRPGQAFAVRDLVGGPNFDWQGTPLYPLFERHLASGKTPKAAIKRAAIDLGWLVKTVISEDKRTFAASDAGRARGYSWLGNEP
ncbi:MAG TPA: hypothetical protein VG796_24865 [Verrucomicrobiales bacterium]|nr:hypothetical protein [Verrucomicrobiales bacterium]